VTGWRGPASVKAILADEGQVILIHKDREIRCRFQDVRPFIGFGWLLPELLFLNAKGAFAVVRDYVESKECGSAPTIFGYIWQNSPGWTLTKASKTHGLVFEALNFLIKNTFRFEGVVCVRLGKGLATLADADFAQRSFLMYWEQVHPEEFQLLDTDKTSLNLREIVGTNFLSVCFVQFLMTVELGLHGGSLMGPLGTVSTDCCSTSSF
jgi:hypothetical protein